MVSSYLKFSTKTHVKIDLEGFTANDLNFEQAHGLSNNPKKFMHLPYRFVIQCLCDFRQILLLLYASPT